MNNFNIDNAVKHIKVITDNYRCTTCDHLSGSFVRYFCGHTICETCAISADICLLCFSPPEVSSHISDEPLNLRVQHASNLLHTFEDLFNINVYRWHRTSEHLKVERKLFPECIQAPSKYYNRKSLNTSTKYKENIKPILPGSNVSNYNSSKMENVIHNVQQWLNKNEISLRESNLNLPRTPFADLNVNGENIQRPKTVNKVAKNKNKLNQRKASAIVSRIKNIPKASLKKLNENVKMRLHKKTTIPNIQIKSDKNESGIVVDEELLVIEDSQNNSNDKDKLAWLAVIEADKRNSSDITSLKSYNTEICKAKNTKVQTSIQHESQEMNFKIPFYKKSSLININNYCYEGSVMNQTNLKSNCNNSNKNITITIDNNSFITTIQFSHSEAHNSGVKNKHSVEVQTTGDKNNVERNCDENLDIGQQKLTIKENSSKTNESITTSNARNVEILEECKLTEYENQTHQPLNKSKCLIIDDSDTDSDLFTASDSLREVTAEVHRSDIKNDYGILTSLEQEEFENRARHRLRGRTPASTDSSDKENYDPNRAKRQKLSKKYCNKKY